MHIKPHRSKKASKDLTGDGTCLTPDLYGLTEEEIRIVEGVHER
jgi:hypothetical protein